MLFIRSLETVQDTRRAPPIEVAGADPLVLLLPLVHEELLGFGTSHFRRIFVQYVQHCFEALGIHDSFPLRRRLIAHRTAQLHRFHSLPGQVAAACERVGRANGVTTRVGVDRLLEAAARMFPRGRHDPLLLRVEGPEDHPRPAAVQLLAHVPPAKGVPARVDAQLLQLWSVRRRRPHVVPFLRCLRERVAPHDGLVVVAESLVELGARAVGVVGDPRGPPV
mmetsp:Transcript_38099/g.94522  ORF Transcript_38099/g.94522 Transcript_38099/m.94522 type:complete len:222 (+) Transcript_38099:339-1004(+)